jgi:hypothetical protein
LVEFRNSSIRQVRWRYEKDLQNHSGKPAGIKLDPPFESLRNDARFQKLVRVMGLEP